MPIEDILVALRAAEEGAIDRDALGRLLGILDSFDRGGLHPSCGELLTRQFRIDPAKVRRWEREIGGQAQRRIGRYQLRRKVGQGGMGVVFEATDPNLGRTVALKLLAGDRLESPISVQRFLREARSAGSFNHPNIVHAFDAGIDGDLPFLVMEFIDGENLYQVLKRRGTIGVDEGIDWLIQGARALEVIERQRWVHGDVKPSNFILTRDGTVKLADLGLCGPPGKPRPGLTPHGTPPYIAPEVLAGEWIDHRADLYALGATFFEMLVGNPPFPSLDPAEVVHAHLAVRPASLGEVRPEIPPELSAVVMKLLEVRAEDRYPGAAALLAALEPLLPAHPDSEADTEAAGADIETQSAAAPRRGLWGALILSVAAVGIAIGVVAGPRLARSPERGSISENGAGPAAAVDPGTAERLAAWQDARSRSAGDYPALFRWLAAEGSELPEAGEWRDELLAELAAEADATWRSVAAEADLHRSAQRFQASLAALDRFPSTLRAGPYEVAWREAVEATLRQRQARLARALLALDGAEGAIAAWQWWRALESEPPEDLAWYRLRLREELGGLPFLAEIDRTIAEDLSRVSVRRGEVRRALREGRVPEPDLAPGPLLLEEVALAWLAAHPEACGSAAPLLERLAAAELLAGIDPTVLGLLLRAAGEEADARAEVTAARLAVDARAACRAFDRAGAEERWALLGAADLAGTTAARSELARSELVRDELRRGAFLRGGGVVALVTGELGAAPRFRWAGEEPRLFEEWRAEREKWSVEAGGLRARAREKWQGLELAIPFEPAFDLALEIEVTDEPWAIVIGRGEGAIALAGEGAGGEGRATGGARAEIAELLADGRGAPWLFSADPSAPARLRIELRHETGLWRLGGGAGLVFPIAETPPPAWIWLAIPAGALLRAVEVTGAPVAEWLDAREALRE